MGAKVKERPAEFLESTDEFFQWEDFCVFV